MSETTTTRRPRTARGHRTYSETVALGFYDKSIGGLSGKHDNVRTYWEDQLTRLAARPIVKERAGVCGAEGRGARILDLGCGAGQGFELLTRIYETESLRGAPQFILPPQQVSLYLGLDLSDAMVEQGRRNYAQHPALRFLQADLREGLGPAAAEPPFDLYFSSYGAMSHLDDAGLKRLLGEIVGHAMPGSGIVLDLVGRYSLEWPGYWSHPDRVLPYAMSYLYDESERQNGGVESFPLRFWAGEEIRSLCRELSAETGVPLELVELMDRSLMVGRHVDTREYGTHLPPLRSRVNRLYEQNIRTRIAGLRVEPPPLEGPPEVNTFLAVMVRAWNQMVDFTLERLDGRRVTLVSMPGWREFPPALQLALMTIDRIIDSVAWIDVGDIRANIIEPQLGYALRRLEYALQRGLGCGHGLVAVLRVGRPV